MSTTIADDVEAGRQGPASSSLRRQHFRTLAERTVAKTGRARACRHDRAIGRTMLRTCMYTPSPRGGHARYARELLRALGDQDGGATVRPELVTSEDLDAAFDATEYPVHRVLPRLAARHEFSNSASWAYSRLRYYRRREGTFLRWLASRPDIAVVHLQEFAPWLLHRSVREMRRLGKKVFYTVHNVTPHKYPPAVPRRLHDGWRRAGLRATDGLFVHSAGLRAALEDFLGPGAPPVHVIPHGVWSIAAPSGADGGLREKMESRRLLFFGSIRENKGLHHLLDALAELPQFSLTVAGHPGDRRYFQTEVVPRIGRLRDAGRKVELVDRFVGEDEVDSYFRSHGAIVMPYTRGFAAQSGVAYLAIAHATPMVATPAGGLGEIFDVARVGKLADGFGPAPLAAAIQSLFREDGDALEQEFRIAREHFSWAGAAEETARAYRAAAPVCGGTHAHA